MNNFLFQPFDKKHFPILPTIISFALSIGLAAAMPERLLAETDPADSGSFAVVELFTSEGCSSCPPMDAFLSELTQAARFQHKSIYPLSFHVDYWNYLGWEDPFSKKQYSQRQRLYAKVYRANSIYTPQLIINGQEARRSNAEELIKQALATPVPGRLKLAVGKGGQILKIHCQFENVPAQSQMNIAWVERDLVSQVADGENSGRVLRHDNVVRRFQTGVIAGHTADVNWDIPAGINLEKSSIIAYVQKGENMHILAVGNFDLSQLDKN